MESPLRPEGAAEPSEPSEPSEKAVASATQSAVNRLREQGIEVSDDANPESIVDLLDAVDAFGAASAARGCDTFTNTLKSSQPDDESCVLPRLRGDESIVDYTNRVRTATGRIAAQ